MHVEMLSPQNKSYAERLQIKGNDRVCQSANYMLARMAVTRLLPLLMLFRQ
jgi:hypothetical protein